MGASRSNPAANIEDKKEPGNRTIYFTHEELQRLLSDQKIEQYIKHMILFMAMTGMRRQELRSLRWADVNLVARVLIIKQSKSGNQRSIKINDTLMELLLTLPSKGVSEHVLTREDAQEDW